VCVKFALEPLKRFEFVIPALLQHLRHQAVGGGRFSDCPAGFLGNKRFMLPLNTIQSRWTDMKYNHHIMIVAATITASFTTGAQEVYENVDQQGVVEFSDQPSSGAKPVDVRPNVVDVAPVKPIESSPPDSPTGAAKAPTISVQPEVIQEGVTGDYYDDRERRPEREKRMERREEAVRQPVRKELGREAVHQGAHRR
jgi:hypothetical protein